MRKTDYIARNLKEKERNDTEILLSNHCCRNKYRAKTNK